MRIRNIFLAAVTVMLVLMCWTLLRIGAQRAYVPPATDKVGMLLNGSAQDRGFSQALYEAASAVCARRGLTFVFRDGVTDGEEFRSLAGQMIAGGCTLILCDSEDFDAALSALAREEPRVCFLNAMGTVKAHNLSSCMRRTYQARYLTGIVAGAQTETGEIGYVVSELSLETIRQLDAFALGVRYAAPEARVYVRCTGDRHDGERAAQVTAELLDAHDIDVMSLHAVPIAALSEADRRGVWTIGYSMDGSAPFPDTWLTGYTFDWVPFYDQRIEEWQQHRFVGRQYRGGIRNGLVSLAPLSDRVRPEARELVEERLAQLLDGSFDVFFGPIRDDRGVLRVREGETMSDDRILHGLDWFVEGVAAG